jgi:hypothetical protein
VKEVLRACYLYGHYLLSIQIYRIFQKRYVVTYTKESVCDLLYACFCQVTGRRWFSEPVL